MESLVNRYLRAAVVFASCAILSSCAGLNHPTGTIEQKFAATGVWQSRRARGALAAIPSATPSISTTRPTLAQTGSSTQS